VLQKTYDDSYLSCSTAVYHESQGNEIEAMRHWRSALDQIYDHNANKALPLNTPRSDTEKALIDALKQLELQCKERIDLLEALRVSRQEDLLLTPVSSGKLSKSNDSADPTSGLRGSIGQGTIPAVTYSELSRPALPKRPSNHRPSLTTRSSSDAVVSGEAGNTKNADLSTTYPLVPASSLQKQSSAGKSPDAPSPLRSPSPDKYTMRTTLRSGKGNEKPPKAVRKSTKSAGEGSSKAATLAWSSLTARERLARSMPSDRTSPISQRHSSEQARQPTSSSLQWDSHSRRLVVPRPTDLGTNGTDNTSLRHSDEYSRPSNLSVSAASSALNNSSTQLQDYSSSDQSASKLDRYNLVRGTQASSRSGSRAPRTDFGAVDPINGSGENKQSPVSPPIIRKKVGGARASRSPRPPANTPSQQNRPRRRERPPATQVEPLSSSSDNEAVHSTARSRVKDGERARGTQGDKSSGDSQDTQETKEGLSWKRRKASILKNLPPGVDEGAAKQILNDVVVQGDEVRWADIAGLDIAKNALREAVVYPFLRPDLFMGLREPARGMLLFGPPGTGKTMLARAVATESRSTFFSISASSLTSKFLGESEKLVRALFGLAKLLAPSIIFVDEIDSLLSQRSGGGEHEATQRIKTEFLIQWSDLQRAAAGRETTEKDKERGDANRVLVLAATNLPWAIDEAARRRFVRRQYIPLPESNTRKVQLSTLLGQQKHHLSDADINRLVELTDGK
jgi:SpoVK/Ycf46/Vps4 family AAA+-type ATPase